MSNTRITTTKKLKDLLDRLKIGSNLASQELDYLKKQSLLGNTESTKLLKKLKKLCINNV